MNMNMFVSVFQSKTVVRVTSSNAHAASPLIVAGYNVSGSVRSDGEPMKGVMFLLFSSSVSKEVMVAQYLFNMSMAINKNQIVSRFTLTHPHLSFSGLYNPLNCIFAFVSFV